MTKKLLRINTPGTYVAPECRNLSIQTGRLICGSLDALLGAEIEDGVLDDWTNGGTVLL